MLNPKRIDTIYETASKSLEWWKAAFQWVFHRARLPKGTAFEVFGVYLAGSAYEKLAEIIVDRRVVQDRDNLYFVPAIEPSPAKVIAYQPGWSLNRLKGNDMELSKGTMEAISEIAKIGKRISVDEMTKIASTAQSAGGSLVAIEPDDDNWCGNGRFVFKWPIPKWQEYQQFMNILAQSHINSETLINGIPHPTEIVVNIYRQMATKRY